MDALYAGMFLAVLALSVYASIVALRKSDLRSLARRARNLEALAMVAKRVDGDRDASNRLYDAADEVWREYYAASPHVWNLFSRGSR